MPRKYVERGQTKMTNRAKRKRIQRRVNPFFLYKPKFATWVQPQFQLPTRQSSAAWCNRVKAYGPIPWWKEGKCWVMDGPDSAKKRRTA